MWLITREGSIYWILRYKYKELDGKKKICIQLKNLFIHLMYNDGLFLSFCFRNRGSNYNIYQRILNLFWLIILILFITSIIVAFNNDINPQFCLNQNNNNYYIGTETFCIHKNELIILIIFIFILCLTHFIHRLIFQRIHPNKLQMDLHKLLSINFQSIQKSVNI